MKRLGQISCAVWLAVFAFDLAVLWIKGDFTMTPWGGTGVYIWAIIGVVAVGRG